MFVVVLLLGCTSQRGRSPGPVEAADSGPGPTDTGSPPPARDTGTWVPPPQNSCEAGRYEGRFDGKVQIAGRFEYPTTGTMLLTLLESSQEGCEICYDISDGTLDGIAVDPAAPDSTSFPFAGEVHGTLNCTTLKLENGQITNAHVTISMLGEYQFVGTLNADYDTATHSFVNGVWTGTQTTGLPPGGTGEGTWGATWMP